MTVEQFLVVATALIAQYVRRPDKRDDVLRETWLGWHGRPDVEVKNHVFYACKKVFGRRELCETPHADAMWNATGGWPPDVADPDPGPDVQAEWTEQWTLFWSACDERERDVSAAYLRGLRNYEVAELLEVTEGRATQIRKRLRRHLPE